MQQRIKELNKESNDNYKQLEKCPYCQGKIIKRGARKKKYEQIQIYYCKSCDKRFTSAVTKNKTYPLKIIIDSLTLYNKLNPIESIPEIIEEKYGIKISQRVISDWLKEYEKYTPFLRMREFASKNYSKKEIIEESKLFHQQIYNFRYNRAKLSMILEEDFKHHKFKPLKEFLELTAAECPNHIFQNSGKRASAIVDKDIKIESNMGRPIQTSNKKEVEVGAAWLDKKSKDRLSVKDSRIGAWKEVNISDLKKIDAGYKQETDEGIFIFKKLSEKEKINSKMPVYRIYKIE